PRRGPACPPVPYTPLFRSAVGGTGDVALAFSAVPGRVAVRTSSGDITVTVPRGRAYNVRAEAAEGVATVAVGQDPGAPATIEARTETADITVGDPSYAW